MRTRRCNIPTASAAIREAVGQGGRTPFLIAIDGRCASGKSTLAGRLARENGWGLIHMDDFFLRPEQRSPERYAEPGGNVDRERFLEEVLLPLRRGQQGFYRPYNFHRLTMLEPVRLPTEPVVLVEGSYSCHPELREHYDLRVFLTVSPDEQLSRIEKRNGTERLAMFKERWIPLEERYFQAFRVDETCGLCFQLEEK